MISLIEPSPFEAGTAYAAVDAHKLDDFKPYIFKTGDFGKTWSAITTGLPDGSYVHAVREDPKRKGPALRRHGNRRVVSFDDGAHWQALQLISRRRRSTTSSFTATISSLPPMAEHSGCSMTSVRCARRLLPSPPKTRTCSPLVRAIRTRMGHARRPATPSEKILPTARRSTTT